MEGFLRIKDEYKLLHEEFLQNWPILTKHLPNGVWAPSIPKEVYKICERYADPKKRFLDLGSGDGLVVLIASLFFKDATGIELDPEFYSISVEMRDRLDIANANFLRKDFMDASFKGFDILYIAPDKEFTLRLENKIEKELDGILIVYSSIFQPKTLGLKETFSTKHFEVYVYENKPKNV